MHSTGLFSRFARAQPVSLNVSIYEVDMKTLGLTGMAFFIFCVSLASADPRIADIRKEYQTIRSALSTYTQEVVELAR